MFNAAKLNGKKTPTTISYLDYAYPKDHWSIDYTKAGTSIATVTIRGKYHYSIILNPTDCRGYRSIIRFLNDNESDIQAAFNRPYSIAEQRGLNDLTTIMAQIYIKLGLIPQFSQLGNNSHSYKESSGTIQVGNEDEPSMLHLHMWGRGDPEQEYIEGVPLRGPQPGLMFDLIAKSQTIQINQYAIKWDFNELQKSLDVFKNLLADYIKSSEFKEEFGDIVEVKIHHVKESPKGANPNSFWQEPTGKPNSGEHLINATPH